jgi:D-alanyl-D-alanine carboxypeptidase
MKYWSYTCLAGAVIIAFGCSSLPHEQFGRSPAAQNNSAEVSKEEKFKALENILDTFLEDGAPGAAVYVKAPDFEYSKAGGWAEVQTRHLLKPDDLYRIASVSKTYFGVLAAILHLEGKINLYATLGESFPQIAARFKPSKDPKTGEIWDPNTITLYGMLQHRAGISDPLGDQQFQAYEANQLKLGLPIGEDVAVNRILAMGLTSKPGTSEVYSNGGFILAAYIVEQVTGHPYSTDMREKVIVPLGLKDTYNGTADHYDLGRLAHGYDDSTFPPYSDWYNLDPQGNGFANGGIVSNPVEVAQFYRAIFKDPSFPVGLDKNSFLKTFLPNQSTYAVNGNRYAMGIELDEDGCFTHDGFFLGYIGGAMYCPNQDLTIVIHMTSDSPHLQDVKLAKFSEIKKLWTAK